MNAPAAASSPAPAVPAPATAPNPAVAAGAPIVVAQAGPAGAAGSAPTPAVPAGPATATPLGGRVEPPPPPPGQTAEVKVLPGMRIVLPDPAFLPPQAKYLVQGDDLVVETAQGGILNLVDFFAVPNATLSVAGRPPVTNAFLFEAAVVDAAGQTVIPTAPPTGPAPATQGNASFSPYDAGDIGPGIPATGPLGPTDLFRGVTFELREANPAEGGENGGNGPPPPPANNAPIVTLVGRVDGTVVADPIGFNPPGNAPLPTVGEGRSINEAAVNGLPPGFVTLDTTRGVEIVFTGEVAGLVNALGVVFAAPDGRLTNARIAFPKVNGFDTTPPFQDGSGPLRPGDRYDLGEVPAGTTIGLFLVQQGGKLPGVDLSTGRIEIRDPVTGAPADLDTLTGPPRVVHIAPNGTETILPVVFHTLDPTLGSPNSNPLNPFGLGHVISGYDNASGDVAVSFEDLAGRRGTSLPVPGTLDPATGRPWLGRADRDFNDAAFAIRFAEVSLGDVLFLGDRRAIVDATISDPDGDRLASASLRMTAGIRPGDAIGLAAGFDSNGDGIVDGTNIRVTRVSDTELTFTGVDSAANFVRALGAVTLMNPSGTILAGERTFTLTVTDERGATSAPASTRLVVNEDRIVLGDGDNSFVGTDVAEAVFGGRGNDQLFGAGGNDLLIGGSGDDELNGGDGDDILVGLGGRDVLVGGRGADRFVYTALSDGFDIIRDFNSAEGDRLDLEKFFRGTAFDPNGPDASSWLRFVAIDFDGAGGLNDVRVEVDRDGPGSGYGFSTAFIVLNQVSTAFVNIENATTFGNA